MPFSLNIIKKCSANGIDYKGLHVVDVISIIYSIDIDNIKEYLKHEYDKKLKGKGINSIKKATEEDFDAL